MTYEEAIRFWFSRVNYEQRSPKPSDLKLDRMRTLLDLLGKPQDRLRIVHVAGSKGKGSTSAMMASILGQAGYRTGLFTSPHLSDTEERIQIDNIPISHEELAALMTDVKPCVERMDRRRPAGSSGVTFFEIATAMGMLHFQRRRTDIVVLEVGLGGRFDATNVCRPMVSIITSISFDHTQQLGNTLAKIAMEKAGIVKPGRPAVSGVAVREARDVIEAICRQRGARLAEVGVDFHFSHEPARITADQRQSPKVTVATRRRRWPAMELGLLGAHQAANAALAVAAVEELRAQGLHIADQAVAMGLAGVQWPARLEVLGSRPLVVLDCAHNVASARALVETLEQSFPPIPGPRASANGTMPGRRSLIFASSNDKDLSGMLATLAPHFAQAYVTRFSNPRSAPPETLLSLWQRVSERPASVHATAHDALQAARAAATADDLICIAGSVFLAGELRPVIRSLVDQKRAGAAPMSQPGGSGADVTETSRQ
jgi:dihydrofolate synthase/folylpolyglutamate synthase